MKKPIAASIVLSLFGLVSDQALMAQTVLRFSNLEPDLGINAPFYEELGGTRLSGGTYVAGLWVGNPGSTPDMFVKVGASQPFRTGSLAGYWSPANLTIPIPGSFLVQVRFWDVNDGATYDQVVAVQGRLGVSKVLQLAPPPFPSGAPPPSVGLTGLQAASLTPITSVTRGLGSQVDSMRVASGVQTNRICGITVGTNRWFRFTNAIAGQMVFNTTGSSIDTVLGLFSSSITTPQLIVCNDDMAPGQTASQVQFQGAVNTLYQVNVSGKNGAFGDIRLNYFIGTPLDIRKTPSNTVELSWPADASTFVLQSTTNPTFPNSWATSALVPKVEGNRTVLQLGPTNHGAFYRLHKP